MVKLNRIYTRTGDDGTTGLADGSRTPKHDPRVEAYGDVDEANAAIGIAARHVEGADADMLRRLQNELFDLGADLATPIGDEGAERHALRIVPAQVERLEREIDAMNGELGPLTSFILPGGGAGAAHLHLARAIVRRAERAACAAAAGGAMLNPVALAYLNRVSDHLFTLCRWLNRDGGDILWTPGATR